MSLTLVITLLARVCLVLMFPFSALDKIIHWKNALAQANSSILPDGRVLLVLAIIVETITPLCIVIGWHDRLAAFVLAGFCVITAFLYHPFWAYRDFWSESPDSKARGHFWEFTKNFGLVGGLLLIVFGGPLVSPASVIATPLSSTHAYRPGAAR